ncbi:hypothetical protein BJ684DRAFT_17511, partial [Piptocephalis cylindrospora]
ILLGILGHYGVIEATTYWTTANISTGLQAILVCFEMIIFALLHIRAFPYAPYMPGGQEAGDRKAPKRWWKGISKALNPWDLVREIYRGIHYMITVILLRRPSPYTDTGAVKENSIGAGHGNDGDDEDETRAHGMDLQRAVTGVSSHHLPRTSLEMESSTFHGDGWSEPGAVSKANAAQEGAGEKSIQVQPEARPPMQGSSEKYDEDVEVMREK